MWLIHSTSTHSGCKDGGKLSSGCIDIPLKLGYIYISPYIHSEVEKASQERVEEAGGLGVPAAG